MASLVLGLNRHHTGFAERIQELTEYMVSKIIRCGMLFLVLTVACCAECSELPTNPERAPGQDLFVLQNQVRTHHIVLHFCLVTRCSKLKFVDLIPFIVRFQTTLLTRSLSVCRWWTTGTCTIRFFVKTKLSTNCLSLYSVPSHCTTPGTSSTACPCFMTHAW